MQTVLALRHLVQDDANNTILTVIHANGEENYSVDTFTCNDSYR